MGHTTVIQKGSEHQTTKVDPGSTWILDRPFVKRRKESERKSISDLYPALLQQAVQVQQQFSTLAEALDNGYAS